MVCSLDDKWMLMMNLEFDKIRDEEYKFREFVFAKACEFTEKYEDFMEEVMPSLLPPLSRYSIAIETPSVSIDGGLA